ncbi:MAG: 2Fe-2S iron-sulfur cluster-binding protein, partial [Pseudomonadota bacterium]
MSARGFRLSGGGLIDRTKPVSFRFAGRAFQGYQGDTIASALLARGEHLVARSFKYHRPRGILGAGSEDPAGLVQIGSDAAVTDPNVRATEQEIFEGLEALAQNCWPSVDFDAGAVNDLFSALLPAGFYYKTFMGPPAAWSFFEPIIRRAAGLGVGPQGPDPDRYETANRHCDVLVCGGGPAGLMAALAAARSGLRVILVEETPHLGGRFLSIDQEALRLDGQTPAAWVQSVRNELDGLEDVQILTRTCAVGYYADNFVTAWEKVADHLAPGDRDPALPRQRFWRIRAKKVVLATGSIERPIVFNGNDRPGVMLASAVRTYIHRFGVVPGRRAILFTNNDDGWQTAIDLHNAGAAIHAIIDSRRAINPPLLALAAERGIALHPGSVITATRGRKHISQVTVRSLDGDNEIGIACDLLAVSGGHSPNVALFSQSRGRLAYDDTIAGFRPGESWQNEVSVGACNGTFTTADCLAEGVAAGSPDSAAVKIPYIAGDALDGTGIAALWEVPANLSRGTARSFVDLQNDVTAKDLKLAVSEGYDSVEHAKRYTTMGMGTDQGKTSGMNAFGILAGALSISIPTLGVTTYRQPFKPVTFGALAGQHVGAHFQPRRTTPMHDWHVENGAIFEPVGDWLRPWTYPRAGESHEAAIARECRAARSRCGVVDATTLGKIDVRGPDARTFLGRIYTNAWAKLPPGQCRYGLMLGE